MARRRRRNEGGIFQVIPAVLMLAIGSYLVAGATAIVVLAAAIAAVVALTRTIDRALQRRRLRKEFSAPRPTVRITSVPVPRQACCPRCRQPLPAVARFCRRCGKDQFMLAWPV